jgi:two-component system phosphate regulon response regulator PhoB
MPIVLVVDDDCDIRMVIRMQLERLDCRILEASSSDEALALTRQQCPNLILLDWTMPGVSGIDFLRTLREDPTTKQISVIMMTGRDDPSERTECQSLGVLAYLVKPFSPKQLLQEIERHLALKH